MGARIAPLDVASRLGEASQRAPATPPLSVSGLRFRPLSPNRCLSAVGVTDSVTAQPETEISARRIISLRLDPSQHTWTLLPATPIFLATLRPFNVLSPDPPTL
eukprot:275558-Rhodomonas_salina.3